MLWTTALVQALTGQRACLLRVSTPRAAISLQLSGSRELSELRTPATLEDDATLEGDASDTSGAPFSASRWHRERRRQILADHPEVRDLIGDDSWVFALGLVLLPLYGWVLWHSPEMSWGERAFHVWTTCSLRASWAVYCSHAISHGRWRAVGPLGSARFNLALAVCNIGTVMGILPSYWLTHHGHHTNLGKYSVAEARQRAKEGRQTDGDVGIASRLFSPPSRKYRVATGRGGGADEGAFESRVSEGAFQATAVLVHALAPAVFAGYLASALRSPIGNAATRRALALQAASPNPNPNPNPNSSPNPNQAHAQFGRRQARRGRAAAGEAGSRGDARSGRGGGRPARADQGQGRRRPGPQDGAAGGGRGGPLLRRAPAGGRGPRRQCRRAVATLRPVMAASFIEL